MKRIISVFAAAVLFITGMFGFTSCSSDDSTVLYFAVQNTAVTFDPQIAGDGTAKIVVRNCFEGLIRLGEDSVILPGVASSWTVSPDGLTYTFNLRQDAVWHLTSNAQKQLEGKLPENFDLSVTAYDFEFGIKRALDPLTGSSDAYIFNSILNAQAIFDGTADVNTAGVKAIDKYTLQITLSQPENGFLNKLAEPVAMPCNQTFFEACGGRYGILIKYSLSNGPFYLSRFDETSYRINKSSDYMGNAKTKADAVWLYYVADENTLLADLAENGYSGALLAEPQYLLLTPSKDISVEKSTDINRSFIVNTSDPVLQNINIRCALFAATNAKAFAEAQNKPSALTFVPSAAAEQGDSVTNAYNEQKAQEYLKKGLEELQITAVNISVITDKAYEEALKRQLQEWQRILGVSFNIKINAVTSDELVAAVTGGSYDVAFYPVKAPSSSADDFFAQFTSKAKLNISGLRDETLDSSIKTLCTVSGEKRISAYKKLTDTLQAYSVLLPVWQESSYMIYTKDISGVLFLTGSDRLYFENATDK